MISIRLILVLLTAVSMLALGAFTLFTNRRERSNQYFALMSLGATGWIIANYLADASLGQSLLWTRLTFFTITVTLIGFLLFTNEFPSRMIKSKLFDATAWLVGIVIALITLLPSFIPAISVENDIANVVTGELYPLFLIYFFGFLGGGIAILLIKLRRVERAERNRIKYVLFGVGFMALIAVPTNLVLPLLLGQNDLASYGSFTPLVFIGFTAYAIVRHRLFNIRLVVARSIAYGLLLITLAAVFGGLLIVMTTLFFPNDATSLAQSATTVALAILLAFLFQPLRALFERITDRFFYRYRYDSQQVLNNLSSVLVSELNLDRILSRSLDTICGSLHIKFGQFIIYNDDRIYRIEHTGALPNRLMIGPELRELDRAILVADELKDGKRKELMESHGIRAAFTLRTREEFVGQLLLGDKLSGDIYTDQDIALLEIISKELAVAILNAKAYAEIQEFNLTLQERVDHATQRLRVANRHLKELDKAKDEFISMASHQLRTPLTTIKGYLSMLLEGDAGKMTATQKEFVDFAFGSSERMVNLISDLLNVSRLSAGRFLIQTKPTDMVAMIKDEVRQLMTHATAKNLQLIFEPPAKPLPLVEIDENKTRQVIMNFIDNAIYYTKEGSVTLVLEQTGDMVRLEVRDTGIGVPDVAKKKLFSKFFRAENAQTVRPDGTGLGLYLARRVVEDQGGTIIFNSVEGKGSTFGFELPLKAPVPTDKQVKV